MDGEDRIAFARGLIRIVDGVLSGGLDGESAAGRLESSAQWLRDRSDGDCDTPSAAPCEPTPGEVRQLFAFWQDCTNRPTTKLTDRRKATIKTRLKEQPNEAIRHVIKWASGQRFFQGENDRGTRYDTIECLLRSTEQLEKYIERSGWKPKTEQLSLSPSPSSPSQDTKRLIEAADQAQKDGDLDEYLRITQQLEEDLRGRG